MNPPTPHTAPGRAIRDHVEVRAQPTVVRLEHLESAEAGWITRAYHLTGEVKNHLRALEQVLARPTGCGIFLIGQYGSGKSHFLAYAVQNLRSGALLAGEGPEVAALSLVNFRAETPLEDIVAEALGVATGSGDRRLAWSRLMERHPRGLLLILDELSEFLRSKPDARRFNEDIRFLQYLGEWAQGARFWVLAALQEQVEHVGELEHGLYRKIKDRFPFRFLLTPVHVRDLIAHFIVKKPGYQEAVGDLVRQLREALPRVPVDSEALGSMYPMHPATLDLLEEVRDRFSQARGVVDFTVTQLLGDPARGLEPFLDRPWGNLITPDRIIDHFRDLLEIQPEFQPLAQQVFPHYRKHLAEVFPAPAARDLAARVLNLLVLAHLSPARRGLSGAEAAHWLLYKATRIDPDRNLEIVENVLQKLADRGRYVVRDGGQYRLDLDDKSAAIDAHLEREKDELRGQGELVFEIAAGALGDEGFNPFKLPRDEWQPRTIRWHFHDRPYAVYLGNEAPPDRAGAALAIRLPWGDARPVPGQYTLIPARLERGEEVIEIAALLRLRERPWAAGAAARLEARLGERLGLFRGQVRAAFHDAGLAGPTGVVENPPRAEASLAFPAWLDRHADWILRRIYPAFERFAPTQGPLPREAYRRFLAFASRWDLTDQESDDFVQVIREGYLVPMGLLQKKGRGYVVPASVEKHELVRLILPIIENEPAPKTLYDHLASTIHGLVPDQVGVLLLFLLVHGEIDILKGKQSLRDLYETLPNPIHYDRVVPGQALSLEEIRDLQQVSDALDLRTPKQWTVVDQRRAIRQLREAGRKWREVFEPFLLKLSSWDLGPEREELTGKVRKALSEWQALEGGASEIEGFQAFLAAIGSPSRFVAALGDLGKMPERFERQVGELQRLRHLFRHPLLERAAEPGIALRVEALGQAPGLDEPEALDAWLKEARDAYQEHRESYARRHDAWWQERSAGQAWRWEPPRLARSRHLGLAERLDALRRAAEQVEAHRCRGLVDLQFQPACACGFDGRTSPCAEEIARFAKLRGEIEATLKAFLEDPAVRERLEAWVKSGLEADPRLGAYLKGEEALPDVADVGLLDRHLAGVELVKEVDAAPLFRLLGERVWERSALLAALDRFLGRFGATRLRFAESRGAAPEALASWCAEHCLRAGVPLPSGLGAEFLAGVAEALQPEWVGAPALKALDDLGLGEGAIDKVVRWIGEGRVKLPREKALSASVGAAMEVVTPGSPRGCRELALLAEALYGQHPRFQLLLGERWLERLEALAKTRLPGKLHAVTAVLERWRDAEWLLIDCLGLPLLGAVERELPVLFPGRRVAALEFALVSPETTTDGFYRQIVEAGVRHSFEKVTVIDSLLHERFLPFRDLQRLAMAELHAACGPIRKRFDPGRPLVVFADHGFRLAPDGGSYRHGGDSTLERVVPVLRIEA